VNLLTQKLDQFLFVGRGQVPGFIPPTQKEVCSLCFNPTHIVNNCPMVAQYLEFVQEQVQAAQGLSRLVNIHFPTLTILAA